MSTRIEERQAPAENASGGIAHLLRVARTECRSAVAFVAASLDDDRFVAAYPDSDHLAPGADVVGDLVEDLVRHLRLDSGLTRSKALLRTVRLESGNSAVRPIKIAVAAVPLGGGVADHPWGFVGVADPDVSAFGFADLQRLSPVARRVESYVAAREVVRRQLDAETPVAPDDAAAYEVAPAPDDAPDAAATPDVVADPGVPRVASAPPTPARTHEPPRAPELFLAPRVLLDRTRRLLCAGARTGSLVVVALAISGAPGPADETASIAARAVRTDLRFDDPVARLGETGIVAVVPMAPGAPSSRSALLGAVFPPPAAGSGVGAGRHAEEIEQL